ncbi:MAG: Yip1 family protein, partial [Bacillota bacterium]|nr:Yip1 family protein [Bacillota bacterium]
MGDKLLDWLFGVIARPVDTLREIAAAKPFGWALLVYVGVTALMALSSYSNMHIYNAWDEIMSGMNLYIPLPVILLSLLFLGIISIFISSGILNIFARIFGGRGSYWSLFSAYAFTNFPMIIGVPVNIIAGFLGLFGSVVSGLISFGLSIWVLVLQVIAVRESHELTTGISIIVYLIYFLILIIVP